ncbi:MAG: MBL fold metallo-hydrolase [Melioribacteraceae bacterium]
MPTILNKEETFPPYENSVTYIGHATVLIHLDDLNIITDPIYSTYMSILAKRHIESGIDFEKLPAIDAILISHEHWDHLDKSTLGKFPKNTPVIISKGLGDKIQKLGFTDVRELSWWDSTQVKQATIIAVPVKHILSKPSGYIIKHNNQTVYFAGDTGLSDHFREIGNKYSIDIALLPIGDYYPRLWFIPGFTKMTRQRHMAPGDVPEAINMLKSKIVIPIHWGTFKISGTGLNEPIEWLNEIIDKNKLEDKIKILKHGEKYLFGQ